MINTFRLVFQVPCYLCNKKVNLYRIYGVLEKKKKKTIGARGPERATAHFGSSVAIKKFCIYRVSVTLGRDLVFPFEIGSQAKRTTRPRRT